MNDEMTICGQDYKLYVDYDRGKYHYLDLPCKVTCMRARVDRDLVRPCRLGLRYQDRVAVGRLVPGLICAGISAAGTFLDGTRGNDRVLFVNFVRGYMHHDLQTPLVCPADPRVTDYADWLYKYVRCGLAHGFALEWGHIENSLVIAYVGISTSGQPQINQDELVEDFAREWNRYLDAVRAAPADPLALKFGRRFDEIFHD
jgi:hypothetical protein